MLDFGWAEFFVIIVIALIFLGPKEIPTIMVALGRLFRRFQYIKFAVSQQFDEVMREADLQNIRNSVNFEAKDVVNFNEAQADLEDDVEVIAEILPEKEESADKNKSGGTDAG